MTTLKKRADDSASPHPRALSVAIKKCGEMVWRQPMVENDNLIWLKDSRVDRISLDDYDWCLVRM